MIKKFKHGIWPTMITAFDDTGKIDFKATEKIVEWYISKGCDGIFAVCQSSEMFYLSKKEKIDLARCVVEKAAGRINVVASGHTADSIEEQIDELGKMAQTGVDAVVLVSNRLAKENESDDVFFKNLEKIYNNLSDTIFGIYECPFPYKRLLSMEFFEKITDSYLNRIAFIKDTCCDIELIKKRILALKNKNISLFNANTATLYQSLILGGSGYNGVMANFHPELYKWFYDNYLKKPEEAQVLFSFLALSAIIELRAYPISAKYHMNLEGISMSVNSRSKNIVSFDKNAAIEVECLFTLEKKMKKYLNM